MISHAIATALGYAIGAYSFPLIRAFFKGEVAKVEADAAAVEKKL